jgi:hypothetical protein
MLGTPFSLLLNPLLWATTAFYIFLCLYRFTSASGFIDTLFPAPVYYAGIAVALEGNGVLFYQKLITPIARQERSESADNEPWHDPLGSYLSQHEYSLCFRLLFTPLWWAFTSIFAYRAARKLLTRSQRSHWEKTPHGHAMATERAFEQSLAMSSRRSAWDSATPVPSTFAAHGPPTPSRSGSGPLVAAIEERSGWGQLAWAGSGKGRHVVPRPRGLEPTRRTIPAPPEPDRVAQLSGIEGLQTLAVTQPLRAVGAELSARSNRAAPGDGRPGSPGRPSVDVLFNYHSPDPGDPRAFRAIRKTGER